MAKIIGNTITPPISIPTDLYNRVETLEELVPASSQSDGWTVAEVNMLKAVFDNIAYVDEATGQSAATQLIESLLGKIIQTNETEQINLLKTVFDNIAYVDETTGQTAANQLIESLLNKATQSDDIEQQNSLLIISSLSNAPTQSGSILSIT